MPRYRHASTAIATALTALVLSGCAVAQTAGRGAAPQPERLAAGDDSNAPRTRSREGRRVSSVSSGPRQPLTSMADVLQSLSQREGVEFIVDAALPERIALGTLTPDEVTLDLLPDVLNANGMYARFHHGTYRIQSRARLRTLATPLVSQMMGTPTPDEIVAAVIAVKTGKASRLVPILRPMLPNEAHLAADQAANALLICDTYENVQRIRALVEQLDAMAASHEQ